MVTLIIAVIFGLVLGYFATLNTSLVNINVTNGFYTIPLYVVIIGSALVGLLISAIINSIDSLASSFALHSKENKIRQKEQTVEHLESRIHDLEIENAHLRGENEPVVLDRTQREEEKSHSFFKKFRYNPTV